MKKQPGGTKKRAGEGNIYHYFHYFCILHSHVRTQCEAESRNRMHADNTQFSELFRRTVDELSDVRAMKGLYHHHRHGDPLPSAPALQEIIDLCRAVLFPGYFGKSSIEAATVRYSIGVDVERLYNLLIEQVEAGLCFSCDRTTGCHDGELHEAAKDIARGLVSRLPEVRRVLATDVEATYLGDPAASNYGEVISCYPVIRALTVYRIAHELHVLGVPLIPRILSELAHSETGIDIHPAATIGEYFTIDHGTGVVVGATCIIGHHVKLYQGVTLGAKNFALDEAGNPVKDVPRHPILEDGVVVYSNATVLGRVTIGRGAVIGGNIWVTHDVPPGAMLKQASGNESPV